MEEQLPIAGEKNRRHAKKYAAAEKAFSRVAETHLSAGNAVRLLRDAAENYPVWLGAIEGARKYIHFECYIIHEDAQGALFAEALIAKAREGVRVRLIYDWMGGFGKTSQGYWEKLRRGGVDVRCYNPFSPSQPLGWLSRDHRKVMVVDGEICFVFGLCVGQMWVGYPEKNIDPWRDTGVELRGPAVAEVDEAFADIWSDIEPENPLPDDEIADADSIADAAHAGAGSGGVSLRVVAGKPGAARVYRLDQMIASMAQDTLWLTDAYFAGTNAYVQSLTAAARDGVDVRLLVPQTTDIPVMRAVSLSGYRRLLEAGVRVYEWDGSMLHAKTAVADGFWSRVGSTNLNIASWLSNCEIDVLIEDKDFGRQMEEMYLADLENATEIVLDDRKKPSPVGGGRGRRARRSLKPSSGSGARYAPSAMAIGSALGSSFSGGVGSGGVRRRELGATEAKIALAGGVLLLVLGAVALLWSKVVAIPLGVVSLWFAVSLFINSYRFFRQSGERRKREERDKFPPPPAPEPERGRALQTAAAAETDRKDSEKFYPGRRRR